MQRQHNDIPTYTIRRKKPETNQFQSIPDIKEVGQFPYSKAADDARDASKLV